jgi:subtilisin
MSKKDTKKRYIVTFTDAAIDQGTVSEILDVSVNAMQDAVEFMATDAEIGVEDILVFEGLGSTSLTMSAAEADNLSNDKRVMAVEEDLEMTIFSDDPVNWEENPFESGSLESSIQQYYQQGYQKGISDFYAKMLQEAKSLYGVESAGQAIPFPPVPFPPIRFPPLPILPPVQPIPWNISLVNAPGAWSRGFRGQGVKVAVLDTGIAAHPDLVISGGASFVPGVVSFNDGHSHGTHCAGIIAARNNFIGVIGVAPMASLYAVKVLSDAGSGSTSWILAGMAWARMNGMNVVSMSLGSSSCQSVAYTNAVAQLNFAGVTVVCASGNGFQTGFPCVGSPANSPGTIAVGAVSANKVIAPFSSRGTQCCPPGANPVSIVAPGVSINSTVLANAYGIKSGTSMACPHVAGAAALVKQRFPFFMPAQIRAKLLSTASDLGVPGNDSVYGAGLLNCNTATL